MFQVQPELAVRNALFVNVRIRAGQNKWAASLSPILGLICALIAWLVTAKKECGNLGVACTGSNNPMLAGNVAALLSPIVLVGIFTLIFGVDKYDWKSMMEIRIGDDHDLADAAGLDLEEIPGGHSETRAEFEDEQKKLQRASKISKSATVVMGSYTGTQPQPPKRKSQANQAVLRRFRS